MRESVDAFVWDGLGQNVVSSEGFALVDSVLNRSELSASVLAYSRSKTWDSELEASSVSASEYQLLFSVNKDTEFFGYWEGRFDALNGVSLGDGRGDLELFDRTAGMTIFRWALPVGSLTRVEFAGLFQAGHEYLIDMAVDAETHAPSFPDVMDTEADTLMTTYIALVQNPVPDSGTTLRLLLPVSALLMFSNRRSKNEPGTKVAL